MSESVRGWLVLSSLGAIGVGLWWERPSASLVAVGAIVLLATWRTPRGEKA